MGSHQERHKERQAGYHLTTSPCRAELVVGRHRVAVQVERASAKGFAVLAEHCPSLEPGQVGQLRTPEAWFDVSVAGVARLVGGDGIDGVCCIGLQRLREVVAPWGQALGRATWLPAVSSGPKRPTMGTASAAAILVGLMAAAGPVALAAWSWQSEHPAIRWLSGWSDAADRSRASPAADSSTPAITPGPVPARGETTHPHAQDQAVPRESPDRVDPRWYPGYSLRKAP
jgi:hypothetical protein